MQVVQAVLGAFHHFDLAQELLRRQHLKKIYSTWPWFRLRREGVPREFVESFVPMHTLNYFLNLNRFYPESIYQAVERMNLVAFDAWVSAKIPPCDAFIAISGVGLKAGQLVQSRGGKFICDHVNTHRRHQTNVLLEEYSRWRLPAPRVQHGQVIREAKIYEQADAIVVPSCLCAKSFVDLGVSCDKVHRIPYGVRLERFFPDGTPPEIHERFEVIFIGQVSLRKGIPYLLKAFAQVRHPNKHLRIVGSTLPDMAKLLPQLPQTDVRFTGPIPQAELPAVLSRCHVLILPSIEDGFGLVVPQAMACGCPAIVSAAAGSSDIITDGANGFIVSERDVEALAERMQRLIDETGLQQRLAAAALKKVRAIGGWQEYGDKWESLLYTLTGKA